MLEVKAQEEGIMCPVIKTVKNLKVIEYFEIQ